MSSLFVCISLSYFDQSLRVILLVGWLMILSLMMIGTGAAMLSLDSSSFSNSLKKEVEESSVLLKQKEVIIAQFEEALVVAQKYMEEKDEQIIILNAQINELRAKSDKAECHTNPVISFF